MFENIGRSVVKKWLKWWKIDTFLKNFLQSSFTLHLQIFATLRRNVWLEKSKKVSIIWVIIYESYLGSTLDTAMAFACSGVWPPIWPSAQTVAALIWSSCSSERMIANWLTPREWVINMSHKMWVIPLDIITAIAKVSECAATYPNIIIPGSRIVPFVSPWNKGWKITPYTSKTYQYNQ